MTSFLVLGGAHLDRRVALQEQARLGASNPGRWQAEPGGASLNAARTLARLGNTVRMVSVRGGDRAGEAVAEAAEEAGIIDMAQVFLDRATPTYSAILDNKGDLVIGVADMDLYDHFTLRQLSRKSIREALAASDHILCDANLPEATLTALAEKASEVAKPLSAIAISPAKISRLSGALPALSVLFLNEAEANTLIGEKEPRAWPDEIRALGLKGAVITRSARPLLAVGGDEVFEINPPRTEEVNDVTGAGDALCAATLDALGRGQTFSDAVRAGIAAAFITVRSRSAAPPDMSAEVVATTMALVPQPVFLT